MLNKEHTRSTQPYKKQLYQRDIFQRTAVLYKEKNSRSLSSSCQVELISSIFLSALNFNFLSLLCCFFIHVFETSKHRQ